MLLYLRPDCPLGEIFPNGVPCIPETSHIDLSKVSASEMLAIARLFQSKYARFDLAETIRRLGRTGVQVRREWIADIKKAA